MTHSHVLPRAHRALTLRWLGASLFCLALTTYADAPVHPDVQRALDYKLPEMTCAPPAVRQRNQNPGQAEQYERKMHFYFKCVEGYQKSLFDDFHFMQTSVSHGVTMAQAAVVKDHLEAIAARIKALQNSGSEAQKAWLKASGERSAGDANKTGTVDLGLKGGGVSTF